MSSLYWVIGICVPILHVAGFVTALEALMKQRSPQGAIAWGMSLITLPYVALPIYLMFGRGKFEGYVIARRAGDGEVNHVGERLAEKLSPFQAHYDASEHPGFLAAEKLARMPFTVGNDVSLLIDGEKTFGVIFDDIRSARHYVLLQFYIVRDDGLGREMLELLAARAREGLRVYFLYDEIGSYDLPWTYIDACNRAGIDIRPFHSTKGWRNRFQINFRNHRKTVVVDGRIAFVGGHNLGDEYRGRDPDFGPWRDTHCRIEGPAAQGVQLSFLEDWYWASGELPSLSWEPDRSRKGDMNVLVLPTGPADRLYTCSLLFTSAAAAARKRLWIASPYFVPNDGVLTALQLAALHGVDVRIMLPRRPDHRLVYLSSFSYFEEAERSGIRLYRYQPGFLHQKTMLIDDDIAVVGTANMDNRSFYLNFEISAICADRRFAAELKKMFEDDFDRCEPVGADDLKKRSFWFKIAVSFARLLSPVE